MEKIVIKGGKRLFGEVEISGSKNAALPILTSFILSDKECELKNVPNLVDIKTTLKLLAHLGAECSFSEDGTVKVNCSGISVFEAPYDLVKTMRASVLVLGPLLAKYGKAKVSLPGGCAIGTRPINLHLKALEILGAKISQSHGYVEAQAKKLIGSRIYFDFPTVGGTENLLMAAVMAKGTTVIENAAREPEIIDLAAALAKMGAKIDGAGTNVITIEGVDELKQVSHQLMPDRIETGTFMVASALTRGNVLLKKSPLNSLEAVVNKLKDSGVEVLDEENGIRVKGSDEIKSVDIKTSPYPGFPTDMQAQMMVLMSVSNSLSVIIENVFENRFMHVSELKRMGANIKIEGRSAVVRGVPYLSGAPVMATDLRASASLILAGLAAEGITEVSRVYHIDRGYEKIEEKLKKIGADIVRVREK